MVDANVQLFFLLHKLIFCIHAVELQFLSLLLLSLPAIKRMKRLRVVEEGVVEKVGELIVFESPPRVDE